MDKNKLSDSVGGISDDKIARANVPRRSLKNVWISLSSVACVALVVALLINVVGGRSPISTAPASTENVANRTDPSASLLPFIIARAEYPDEDDVDSDGYYERSREKNISRQSFAGMFDGFTAKLLPLLFSDGTDNKAVSPINIYMALSILAQASAGDTRDQLLDILGQSDADSLAVTTDRLFNCEYRYDQCSRLSLANSLWLTDVGSHYDKSIIDKLAADHHCSVFEGKMGDPGYDDALRQWIADSCAGLLDTDKYSFDPMTVMSIVSTLYFNSLWAEEFDTSATEKGLFHSANGDKTADMMHQSIGMTYFDCDGFSGAAKSFMSGGYQALFILPDEGTSVNEVISDDRFLDILSEGVSVYSDVGDVAVSYPLVNLTCPRFDIASDTDLLPILSALGATDVLDPGKAEFSVSSDDGLFLGSAEHDVRIRIDEKGAEGAALTKLDLCGAAQITETVDLVLDRPFIVVISDMGLPVFVCSVCEP